MSGQDSNVLMEKFTSFLSTHQRILTDFTRSLENARKFLDLAQVSISQEPRETEILLEQIREIDLLGHLGRQFEEFQQVAELLMATQPGEISSSMIEEMNQSKQNYQELVMEAENQMETIENLLSNLPAQN